MGTDVMNIWPWSTIARLKRNWSTTCDALSSYREGSGEAIRGLEAEYARAMGDNKRLADMLIETNEEMHELRMANESLRAQLAAKIGMKEVGE